jgi:3-deoxy-D-manno-octulosonic-acid transferase
MQVLLYQILWHLARPFAGLWLKKRLADGRETSESLPQRLAKSWPEKRPPGPLFWLHAVSAGEAVAACQLAKALLAAEPGRTMLITTNTPAGAAIVRAAGKTHPILHAFQPLDHPLLVDRFLSYWQPDAALFLESDFWFNLVSRAARRELPVFFASAQLSARSFAAWQRRPALARQLFGAAWLVLAVDAKQARQFGQLRGQPHDPKAIAFGSLKVSREKLAINAGFAGQLRQAASGRAVLLAASTHADEEQLIHTAWQALPEADRPLLILAPRHPGRAADILADLGPLPQRSRDQLPERPDSAYLCDSMGEMGSLFAAADLVILGGSLVPAGGHNPLEPALFGKPILAGPHHFKNQADYEGLVAAGAMRISAAEKLATDLATALADTGFRMQAAEAGPAFVEEAARRPERAAAAIDAALKEAKTEAGGTKP